MKVNKTNALAFLAISIMLFGGAYTFNWVSNSGNGYKIEYLPGDRTIDNAFNIPEMVNNPKIDKVDPVLNEWINTGLRPSNLRRVGTQTSVLLFTNGAPSLNGIDHTGFFKLSSSIYYVQALVDGVDDLRSLAGNPGVLRLVADFSTRVDPKYGDLESPVVDLDLVRNVESVSDVGQVPESFRTREILQVDDVVTNHPDTNGTGAIINVHDTGIDYGHAALQGTLAMTNNGESAAFDGTGDYTSGTNLMTAGFYGDYNATLYADEIALFSQELTPDANGNLNLTGYGDLILWSPTYHDAYTWSTIWTVFMGLAVPTTYDVSAVATASDSVTFGVSWTRTGPIHMWVPFVLVDTGNTGTYDKAYHDWDTGLDIISWWYEVNSTAIAPDYSFDDNTVAVTAAAPYLASDWMMDDGTAGADGFPDLSIGALGNMYDIHDLDFDDDKTEIWTGIHAGGYGYAYMFDYQSHGTGVAGSIAAQDVDYKMYSNTSDPAAPLYSIQGVAPGADLMATSGLLSTSSDVWSYLWVTGYEPDSTGNWTQSGQHQADVSSNSWGFLSFYGSFGDGQVHGFDLYSMFMEVLSYSQADGGFFGAPGILFVISAGNTGNGYGTMGAPEPLSALLVGASTNSYWRTNAADDDVWSTTQGFDEIIGFSSAGPTTNNYPKVDVVNIGAFDYSTYPTVPFYDAGDYNGGEGANNSYQLFGGTSQAAPYTSAAAAYVIQADNALTPNEVKLTIKSSAVDLGYDVYRQGSGRVNVSGAVELALGNEGNLLSTSDGMTAAGARFAYAMNLYLGMNSTGIKGENGWGINDTDSAAFTYPTGHADTGVAFGSFIQGGTSATHTITASDTSVAFVDAFTFTEDSMTTVTNKSTARYNYMNIWSNFSDLSGSDFVQFVLNVNQTHYYDATANGAGFRLWVVNAVDDDADGFVDATERELLTYGYNDYHQITITLSTAQLSADSYLAVRDDQFHTGYDGDMTPGATFSVTAIAYSRTADNAVTVTGSAGSFSASVDTATLTPGFYQGYIAFDDGSLAPYTYSVAFQANDYDANSALTAIAGGNYVARGVSADNFFTGAVSLSGRRQSGDWRFVDIYVGNANGADAATRTLAVDVTWDNPGTVLNTYLYNYSGSVIAHNAPAFGGSGTWNTRATSTGNTGAQLLANVTGYDFTGQGAWFTLAVHAVRHNGSIADPLDSFTFGAAFLDADVGDFKNNVAFVNTGSDIQSDKAGNVATNNIAGITWTSGGTANPIPEFNSTKTETTLGINQFTELSADGTMTNPVGDGGAFTSLLFEEEIFLTEGMTVQGLLSWTGGSDVDMIIVAKGDAYSYNTGICGAQASTGANPESFSCGIDTTGTYVVVATYYSGDGASFDWELYVAGLAAVVDTVEQDSTITLSLVDAKVADATYLLTSSTGGWNGGNSTQMFFTFDSAGPAVTPFATTPESIGASVAVGEIYDAGEFTLTLTKGTDTVLDEEVYTPGNHEIVIPSSFMNYFGVDTTFSYSAVDEFGRTTTGSFTIYRDDTTVPEFNSIPADVEVKRNAEFSLSWDIADSSGGHFDIFVNGVEDESKHGDWMPGVLTVDFKFGSAGEYFIKLEVYDALDNGASDTVKVTVKGDSDDGFLPINFVFAIVAIPILVALRRKFNK